MSSSAGNSRPAAPLDPGFPPVPGTGGSDPDKKGVWPRQAGTERTGADAGKNIWKTVPEL